MNYLINTRFLTVLMWQPPNYMFAVRFFRRRIVLQLGRVDIYIGADCKWI